MTTHHLNLQQLTDQEISLTAVESSVLTLTDVMRIIPF